MIFRFVAFLFPLLLACCSQGFRGVSGTQSADIESDPSCGPRFQTWVDRKAERREVELMCALGGEKYLKRAPTNDPKLIGQVSASLSRTGKSDLPYGKVYRVSGMGEALELLADTWAAIIPESRGELERLFRKYRYYTVSFMECDNSHILFFDEEERLRAVFPPP